MSKKKNNKRKLIDQHEIFNGLKHSFNLKADRFTSNQGTGSPQSLDWGSIMKQAIQSNGVVYGDLGIFPTGVKHKDDILGLLSLIFYSFMSITLIKYVFIVLPANDQSDGLSFKLSQSNPESWME
ncbi:potassium transporter 5 [Quercus suber]|uniref:Potassium transporter 5 n=1 Tax=Quercus suber TaxID=58331 RepID=A0AAW0LID6_QUESU